MKNKSNEEEIKRLFGDIDNDDNLKRDEHDQFLVGSQVTHRYGLMHNASKGYQFYLIKMDGLGVATEEQYFSVDHGRQEFVDATRGVGENREQIGGFLKSVDAYFKTILEDITE